MEAHLETMKNEIAQGSAQLFDVRENDEWDAGHLATASLVPLSELRAGLEPEDKDKAVKTYLHCRSGVRVHEAAPLLEDMGFETVIPLAEGFDALASEGFEQG